MTRSYFVDSILHWYDLIDLARDNDCDIFNDIIDDDTLDDYIDYDISESGYGWRQIRDFLDGISTGYDYYRYNGAFDYDGLDAGDFADYKEQLLEWMDDNELWDEEESEENQEEEEEPAEPPEPTAEEEDFSVADLMGMCGAELSTIRQALSGKQALEDLSLLYAS